MRKEIFRDKWIRRICIPLIAIAFIIWSNAPVNTNSLSMLIYKIIRNTFYVTVYWEGTRMLFIYMRNKLPHLKDSSKRIALQILIFFAYIIVASLAFAFINQNFPTSQPNTYLQEFMELMQKSVPLVGLVSVIYECAYLFGLYEKTLYESERLKKESLISQLEVLKSQISPHFLFNNLNALITLVPENPVLSVAFIQKLSNVYRHVLTHNDKNLISLQTELAFLADYLFLYQMRFGTNLIIVYQLPEETHTILVAPFTLQMLIENAVKHNIISSRKPLTISITANENHITIHNNLQKKTSGVESTNTGLQNMINRYELLTHQSVQVTQTVDYFKVSLPIIFNQQNYESIDH